MINIYVGNMSYDTTEDELREAFGAFGAVSKVSIIMDRETGRPRGFAFVEMADHAAALAAISQLNGKELDGRAIKVAEARPKRDSRGGGGRRR